MMIYILAAVTVTKFSVSQYTVLMTHLYRSFVRHIDKFVKFLCQLLFKRLSRFSS